MTLIYEHHVVAIVLSLPWCLINCNLSSEFSLYGLEMLKCLLSYIFLICRTKYSQAIMAEGKQHALAIGFTKMSAKDM